MGNYKFKLSDMLPNAWFYKLKDMNRAVNKNQHKNKVMSKKQTISSLSLSLSPSSSSLSSSKITDNNSHLSDQRKSYHFTRELSTDQNSDKNLNPEPPRKSSKKRRSVKRNRPVNKVSPRLVSSTVSAGCSCRATLESVWTKPTEECPDSCLDRSSDSSEHESMLPEYGSDTFDGMLSLSTSCECKVQDDIVIEVNEFHDSVPELKSLPPIITKKQPTIQVQRTSTEFSKRNSDGFLTVKATKENILSTTKTTNTTTTTSPVKRVPNNSPGLKLRTNTPKIANRRINQGGRKSISSNSSSMSTRQRSVSESFAVVKSSKDPRRDFRESMVEMIVENNIRGSKDLEELLACYLSLNSDEYHELIINVFKQIWFDFVRVSIK